MDISQASCGNRIWFPNEVFALLIAIYALLIISAHAYIAALEKQALANSQYSSGIARVIDKVCTSVLIYGSQNRMRLIDDHAVSLVLDCEFN